MKTPMGTPMPIEKGRDRPIIFKWFNNSAEMELQFVVM
jgi:hypothetical protein